MEDRTSGYSDRVGTFFVESCPRDLLGSDARPWLPAHKLVIEPLVQVASEIRVYGCPPETSLPTAVPQRGHMKLVPGAELLNNLNLVWRKGGWSVGAIVIVAEPSLERLAGVLAYCSGPKIWSSRHQMRKGSPSGALSFCEKMASEGKVCFHTPASNGVQWLDIFVPAERYAGTLALAVRECKEFKRFLEHNPGRKSELIIDRPPYLDAGVRV